MLKVYELRPIEMPDYAPLPNYWKPWYDKLFGAVVIAESEQQARKLLQESDKIGDESEDIDVWMDKDLTSCTEIDVSSQRVMMVDFHNG